MFTDRKKFHFPYPGVAVKPLKWIRKGEAWRQPKVNHAQVLTCMLASPGRASPRPTLWLALLSTTASSSTRRPSQQNITAAEYMSVVADTFLPEGERLFGSGGWVLQQDNHPSHKKLLRRQWLHTKRRGAATSNSCKIGSQLPRSEPH